MLPREDHALDHPDNQQPEDDDFHRGVRPRLHRPERKRRKQDEKKKAAGEEAIKPEAHGFWGLLGFGCWGWVFGVGFG